MIASEIDISGTQSCHISLAEMLKNERRCLLLRLAWIEQQLRIEKPETRLIARIEALEAENKQLKRKLDTT